MDLRRIAALVVLALLPALPSYGGSCNGPLSLSPHMTAPTQETLTITLGATIISSATNLVVTSMKIGMACRNHGCIGGTGNLQTNCTVDGDCPGGGTCYPLLPGICVADGSGHDDVNTVMGWDHVASTTCGITWSSNNSGGATPNVVTLTPSSSISIPPNTSSYCNVAVVLNRLTMASNDDTPQAVEFSVEMLGTCNAGADDGTTYATVQALAVCPTPAACDPSSSCVRTN